MNVFFLIMSIKTLLTKNFLYSVSPFDPLYNQKGIEKGFYAHHKPSSSNDAFGDISILTYNATNTSTLLEQDKKTTEAIFNLLDVNHPTFLTLQSIKESVLLKLKADFDNSSHYRIALTDRFDVDLISGDKLFMPIIYDINLVRIKQEGYFATDKKPSRIYAGFLQITDTRLANESCYTIINVDLYSTFNNMVNAQFFNIISDIREGDIKNNPVFMCGTINTMPEQVKKIISFSFLNTLDSDTNNDVFERTTINKYNAEIGQQKDFILLRDFKQMIIVNYARILSDFKEGERFPVFSIFSFRTSRDKNSEVKLFDIIPHK